MCSLENHPKSHPGTHHQVGRNPAPPCGLRCAANGQPDFLSPSLRGHWPLSKQLAFPVIVVFVEGRPPLGLQTIWGLPPCEAVAISKRGLFSASSGDFSPGVLLSISER